jgi:hypothetical protein
MDVNWTGVSLSNIGWEIRDTQSYSDDPASGHLDASGADASVGSTSFSITSGSTPNFKFFWIGLSSGTGGWYEFHGNVGNDYDVSDCMW